MARKVAALVFLVLLGLAFGEAAATAAAVTPKTAVAPSPSEEIGTEGEDAGGATTTKGGGGGGFAEAGPVGGPVSPGVFSDTPTDPTDATTPPKKNGASSTTLEMSTIAGITIVGFSLFYF